MTLPLGIPVQNVCCDIILVRADINSSDPDNIEYTQAMKIELGNTGEFKGFVDVDNPLPVRFSNGIDWAAPVMIMQQSDPTLLHVDAHLIVDGADVSAENPVPVTGTVNVDTTVPLHVLAAQAGAWSVSGSGMFTVGGLGTAGTADSHVVTVQGIAGMTPVTVSIPNPVNIGSVGGTVQVQIVGAVARDYNTSGTTSQIMFGIALPGAGGPVIGGTETDPIRTDPTGTTSQPVTIGDAATLDYNTSGTTSQVVFGIALPGAGGPVIGGTDTDPIRVDPTGTTPQPVVFAEATSVASPPITTNTTVVSATVTNYSCSLVSIHGAAHSGVFVVFEASDDSGTTWYPVQARRIEDGTVETSSGALADNSKRAWFISHPGASDLRVRAIAYTSGSATVRITPSASPMGGAGGGGAGGPAVDVNAYQAGSWFTGPLVFDSADADLVDTSSVANGGSSAYYASSLLTVHGTHSGFNLSFFLVDGGGIEYPIQGMRVLDGTLESTSGVLADNSKRAWLFCHVGALTFTVKVTAYTSGTLKARIAASSVPVSIASGSSSGGSVGDVNLIEVGGGSVGLGQTTMSGSIPVVLASNQSDIGVTGTVAATQSGTWTVQQGGSNWSQNLAQLAGTAVATNSGSKDAGTLRVVIATDQPQLTNALKVDGSAVTQPVSGTIAATQSGAWTVSGTGTAGSAAAGVMTIQGIASMTAVKVDGSAVTQPVSGTVAATQSGTWSFGLSAATATTGATPYYALIASSAAITTIKSGAGNLYALHVVNQTAADIYIQIFDATSPSVGTPLLAFLIPSGAGVYSGAFDVEWTVPIKFTNSIKYALTTASNNAVAPTGNVVVNALYI